MIIVMAAYGRSSCELPRPRHCPDTEQKKMSESQLGVNPDDAWGLLLEAVITLPSERVSLARAEGRVLAQDVLCPSDIPAEDRSLMDGYAVGPPEGSGGEVCFRVVAQRGKVTQKGLNPGEAVPIRTGSPVPRGTWAVVPREEAIKPIEQDIIVVKGRGPQKGSRVGPRGHLAKEGQRLLSRGCRIGPGQIALLKACGIRSVIVARRPRLAVIPTGGELVVSKGRLGPGQSYVSHAWYIVLRARELGAKSKVYPPVPDDPEALKDALLRHSKEADLVVTTGGTGLSSADLTGRALEQLGSKQIFRGLKTRPGRTICAFVLAGTPVILLPGGPGGSGLGCELLVVPALRALQGETSQGPRWVRCVLDDNVDKRADAYRYLEVAVYCAEGMLRARAPHGADAPRGLSPLLLDGWVEIPPGEGELKRGEPVRCLLVERELGEGT